MFINVIKQKNRILHNKILFIVFKVAKLGGNPEMIAVLDELYSWKTN